MGDSPSTLSFRYFPSFQSWGVLHDSIPSAYILSPLPSFEAQTSPPSPSTEIGSSSIVLHTVVMHSITRSIKVKNPDFILLTLPPKGTQSKHQLTSNQLTLYSNTTKEFQKASKWTLKRGLELVEIRVAGRAEGFRVFETLSDVVDVSLVLQDPHEIVAERDQPLHVDGFRGIAHFLGLLRTGSVSLVI